MAYRGIATMRKRLVGSRLRRLREAAGMTIEEVAKELGVSKSVVYRQETGTTVTSVADARTYIDMYGLTNQEEADRLVHLARSCRVRGWWFAYGETAGDEHVDLADIEDLSTEFRIVNLNGFHALLETEEFAVAAMEASRGVLDEEDVNVEDILSLRRKRRAILGRVGAPKIWAIISESSLRLEFPDKKVMAGQIKHLIDLSHSSNISIQLLPMDNPASLLVAGFMSIMGFDGTPDGSVVHTYRSFSDHPEQVKVDILRFSQVQTQALSRGETRTRLESILAEYAKQ
jgi:transcriptional regulator with XRE-family HTH domain